MEQSGTAAEVIACRDYCLALSMDPFLPAEAVLDLIRDALARLSEDAKALLASQEGR